MNMKKTVLVSAFLLIVWNTFAQDIITTTDAQYIKAKIVEVSKDAVKYLEFDNQNGPTFVLSTEDIATIQYQNGKVVAYRYVEEETESDNDGEEAEYISLERHGNTYYYNGMPMKSDVYESFLQERCLSAYNQYRSGHGLAIGGWSMMGCAAGLAAGVGIAYGLLPNSGIKLGFLWILPGVAAVVSIPLVSAGYARMHRSADTFNTMCADKQPQAYWSINASQNGIGLALTF